MENPDGSQPTPDQKYMTAPPPPRFVLALERQLPWAEARAPGSDWFLNLQLEGASAVHSACEILLQQSVRSLPPVVRLRGARLPSHFQSTRPSVLVTAGSCG
jgi:hypothetical protein